MSFAFKSSSIRNTLLALVGALVLVIGLMAFGQSAIASPTDVQGTVLEEFDGDDFDGVHIEFSDDRLSISVRLCVSSQPKTFSDISQPRILRLTGPPQA